MLTKEYLHSILEEREPGILYWRVDRTHKTKAGSLAGWQGDNGYWRIMIDGKSYPRSRIIWKMYNGTEPICIDHINKVRNNDSIGNLRDVTRSENSRNVGSFNGDQCVLLHKYEKSGELMYRLIFQFTLWADEEATSIINELDNVIKPIIAKVIEARRTRERPAHTKLPVKKVNLQEIGLCPRNPAP